MATQDLIIHIQNMVQEEVCLMVITNSKYNNHSLIQITHCSIYHQSDLYLTLLCQRIHSASSGPSSVFTKWPSAVFHTLIIPFISMVARYSPVQLKARPQTLSWCPSKQRLWILSSTIWCKKALSSWPPVANWSGFLGLKATQRTESVCPVKD